MRIDHVSVSYGELRSTGYPHFSNKKIEIDLHAQLDFGETAKIAIDRLHAAARREVSRLFEVVDNKGFDIPFDDAVEQILTQPR